MRFAQPFLLHLLWGVLILGVFLYGRIAYHKKILHRFSQEHLWNAIVPFFRRARLAGKYIMLTGVLAFSVLGLARPQWGFKWEEIKRQGLDILVAVDTSKSMLTQDVKPNRLERTKLAVQDLIKKLKGDRIGLIAFAGDAFMICPLTVDYGGFLLSLNDLNVETVPRGGTNLSRAIAEALRGYDHVLNKYKVIVMITDGDNLEGDPLVQARKAKEMGIKIYCIGIGTQDGELIQFASESGEAEFLKDREGNFVKSRLNEKLLQEIALSTGGVYVRASGAAFGLDLIYGQELARLERREIEGRKEKRYYDRFQIPLAMAFLLLFAETWLTTRKTR
ncbi:MAG: hypothetical protein A3G91_03635 [Omnitrophica WOR_2 bacterium RIFCSPLOWO2_12_FULL_50_9]|nr:MAG: hypothetical protein A3D87_06735 [Omnitrophica WOR_2 bacterium RIFCSPHIGHO2_02_FULL_50_17]OGX43210.1 MAG: hypothetical protein A3G91_03635 [Omnitrophica WOR_2 bacterium RIFCSPLOWO2_12_FULL_50_9]